MRPSDRAFVANSWLRSYSGGEALTPDRYYHQFGAVVDSLIDTSRVSVACNPNDETHVFGWLCRSDNAPTLHYMYVKAMFRDAKGDINPPQVGLKLLEESRLLGRLDLRYTFLTLQWLKYSDKHGIKCEHDATLLRAMRATLKRLVKEAA